MKAILLALGLLAVALFAHAQTSPLPAPTEIPMSREEARQFFGTYEFEPNFRMRIFSENTQLFAQRLGDPDRFQIFPKSATIFFPKTMPAELEFRRGPGGNFDVLVLHQGGSDMQARRISTEPVELYDTIAHLDSLLYRAYNARQLPAFMAYFSPDLEFYHDQTGRTTYQENLTRFRDNFTKPTVMRRELVPGSLQVYPIAGFGAIEIGTHRFYQTNPGQPERMVAEPQFVQVWQNSGGKWQLVRVVSYGH